MTGHPQIVLSTDRHVQATVGREAADQLRQLREAMETLRQAFNALEAKQRRQAMVLAEHQAQHEMTKEWVVGLRRSCLVLARTLGGRLLWLIFGR